MSTANTKDTIYIDVDDEITNIIDKVQESDKKIVALVLPKRAAVLQSIVNMKLLKRTADTNKKHVVLITSEAGLLPLAGAVGLHVAKNLQTKPAVPSAPDTSDIPESLVGEEEIEPSEEPEIDESKSVGELAGMPSEEGKAARKAAAKPPKPSEDETIEIDDDGHVDESSIPLAGAGKAKKPKGGAKKFKIPNFEKFRILLFAGILGVILLLVGIYWALFMAPSAKITVKTDSTTVNSNITFTASTTADELDAESNTIPAERKEVEKTETQKVAATGQKDMGTKASGSVLLALTDCSKDQVTIPAGSGISSNGLTFITQSSVTLNSVKIGSSCKNSDFKAFSTGSVNVTAQNAGDQYNLGARSYQVAGFSNVSATDSTGMAGGTSKIIKVVSQADVDNAKQKLTSDVKQSTSDELKKALEESDMYALVDSLSNNDPAVTVTPNVGEEASEVTVTSKTTYAMFGVKKADLEKVVEDDAKKQIDTSKQSILDNGLADASFVIQDKSSLKQLRVTLQTIVKAGPQLDKEGIKKEVAGKKKGETISTIQSRPAIKDVTVDYSPFWVSKTPKKTSKITIVFDQSNNNEKP